MDGDIFSTESPKAYAPLGYGTLSDPAVVRPEDFKNDIPLPTYDERLPLRVPRPLGATFVDTELQRPSETRLSRKAIPRADPASPGAGKDGSVHVDPTVALVQRLAGTKQALMLGKHVLTEESLVTNRVYLDRILKRKGGEDESDEDVAVDGEGEGGKEKKKARIDRGNSISVKAQSEREKGGEFYNEENTVKAENVLRMVDSSLVDMPNRRERHARGEEEEEAGQAGGSQEEYNENVYASEDEQYNYGNSP